MKDLRRSPKCLDVVVVGAGIAGSALAAGLGARGCQVALLEANPLEPRLPQLAANMHEIDLRVSALNAASTRLLEELGAWQLIPSPARAGYRAMWVWEQDGTSHIDFDCAAIGRPFLGHIVENRWTAGALLAVIEGLASVRVSSPCSLLGFELLDDRVRVRLDDDSTLDARLLVGADGAQSSIRSLAGIACSEHDSGQTAIVATIRSSLPHAATARQCFLQSGPLALLPLGDEHLCSIVWSAEHELARELLELDDAAFAARVECACERVLGTVEQVTRRLAFPLRPRHAATYVKPRVALVADAAHVIHPLAGQGINLGLADVAVLLEELQRASARDLDPGDPAVLGRYERRRRGENEAMLRAMEAFRRLYGSRDPLLRLARNAGLNAVQHLEPLKQWFVRRAMGS